jgi:hypothetical protein
MIPHDERIRAVVLLIGYCSAAYPKQQHLSYEGIDNRYELTFDDSRISSDEMRQIACLSPYIDVYCAPFYIGSGSERRAGKVVVDKVFFAPPLDLCIEQPCTHDPEVADDAFLKDAAVHLGEGSQQVELLRKRRVPAVLEPVKRYLLDSLIRSVEGDRARYVYFKSGELGPMRQILCSECDCGSSEEALFEQLRTTQDPRAKTRLSWQWHNKVLRCGRERRPQRYPMDAWKRFIKEYGITERLRVELID